MQVNKTKKTGLFALFALLALCVVFLVSCLSEPVPETSLASGETNSRSERSEPDFSTYSEYLDWLQNETSEEVSKEEIPFPDASEFLGEFVSDFNYFRELINNRLETAPDTDGTMAPYERVISDHYDTQGDIRSFLSEFMTASRVTEELDFLVSPTTADGTGLPLYRFVDGVTWMNTEVSNNFYEGTWDVTGAEYVYRLEYTLRVAFDARTESGVVRYQADFVCENGIWLLDSIF